MTDERFSELVNLYLDDEISTAELREFSAELGAHAGRKVEFQQRCRLHRAVRLVYDPQPDDPQPERVVAAATPSLRGRLRLGLGLAACVVMTVVALPPLLVNVVSISLNELELLEVEGDAEPDLSVPGLARFARQQPVVAPDAELASVTAHLRLLGLRPELSPQPQALQPVNHASLQPRDTQARELQRFSQWSEPSGESASSGARSGLRSSSAAMHWGGFQTSLAGFR